MENQGLNDINAVLGTDAKVPADLAEIYDPSQVKPKPLVDFNESIPRHRVLQTVDYKSSAHTDLSTTVTSVDPEVEGDPTRYVTVQELNDLKNQVNDSFSEVANLILEQMSRSDNLDLRIDSFNKRGGHKL
jgi:hypothetical protein